MRNAPCRHVQPLLCLTLLVSCLSHVKSGIPASCQLGLSREKVSRVAPRFATQQVSQSEVSQRCCKSLQVPVVFPKVWDPLRFPLKGSYEPRKRSQDSLEDVVVVAAEGAALPRRRSLGACLRHGAGSAEQHSSSNQMIP